MSLDFPFDPLRRAEEVERLVLKGGKRLYYRFRPAPYYGGIATADAIGCSFLCAYCWNYSRNLDPARYGRYYSSQDVASILLKIAAKRSFRRFRITGSEPILGEESLEHFREVVELVSDERPHSVFILETNGLFLGYRSELIERLKSGNLWTRIALKGVDENSFENITGARKEFFDYPLQALKEMEKKRMKVWPAVMGALFTADEVSRLENILSEQGIKASLEEEILEDYPFVLDNMRRRKVRVKRPFKESS